jgi:hypothetical protein
VPDVNDAPVKVDVLPSERKSLALPDSQPDRHDVQPVQSIVDCCLEERSDLLGRQWVQLPAIIASAAAVLWAALSAGSVLGAQPNQQACLGESVSAAATTMGADLGAFVSTVAQETPFGAGDDVQATLRGAVFDVDFPNTCND